MNTIRIVLTLSLAAFIVGAGSAAHAGNPRNGPIAENAKEIEKNSTDIEDLYKISKSMASLMQQMAEMMENICIQADILKLPPPSYCAPNSANLVFATSEIVRGDMLGVDGANVLCTALAFAAGHSGTFKAWLSSDHSQPADTFFHSTKPYVLPDLTRVADNWDDLTDGTIQNRIFQDENGAQPIRSEAWTHTHHDGTRKNSSSPCNNWTSNTGAQVVDTFVGGMIFGDWTESPAPAESCAEQRVLYCFEQAPDRIRVPEQDN